MEMTLPSFKPQYTYVKEEVCIRGMCPHLSLTHVYREREGGREREMEGEGERKRTRHTNHFIDTADSKRQVRNHVYL